MAMIVQLLNSGVGVLVLLLTMLASCAVTYWLARRNVDRELAKVHQEMRSAVEAFAHPKAALTPPAPKPAQVIAMPPPQPKPEPVTATDEDIAHETLVVIAAAVAAYLGKSVRLRSARLIQPMGDSPWAQQGRVYVQASHNLSLAHHGH